MKPSKSILSSKPSRKNITNLREKTLSKVYPKGFVYKPKVSERFLEEWLDFPTDHTHVFLNIMKLPYIWLLYTNKSMAGLDPSSSTIRERLSNQCSVLGTAAGLFLVIAVAGYLAPPKPNGPDEVILVQVYGILMLSATFCFTMYVGLALTNLYPLVQSLRDDMAFDAFEVYCNRWGGYELYFFNLGFQFVLFALVLLARVLYNATVQYIVIAIFFTFYGAVVFLSKEMFLSFDPITSMHLGLSSDPNDIYRAEMMSHYILNKIPNSIVDFDSHSITNSVKTANNEVFTEFPHTPHQLETQRPHGMDPLSKPPPDINSTRQQKPSTPVYSSFSSGVVVPFDHVSSDIEQHHQHPSVSVASRDDTNQVPPVRRVHPRSTGRFSSSYSAKVVEDGYQQQYQQQPISLETAIGRAVCNTVAEEVDVESCSSLESIFKGEGNKGSDSYLLKTSKLSYEDSVYAYNKLIKSGCTSSAEFILLLNETKSQCHCTCRRGQRGPSHVPHELSCDTRKAGLWLNAVVSLDIPTFHALKIVLFFRQYLK